MGCGQSKILIYNRKSKADKNDKHNNHSGDDCYTDASQLPQTGDRDTVATETLQHVQHPNQDCDTNLFGSGEISTSQIDFFKMLDEKIESGADYEEDEQEREQERQRLLRLLNEWLRRPQLDTQRFPTAYHACPPGRPPPRFTPRQPLYPQPRPYLFSRAMTIETAEFQNHDRYVDPRREDVYADHYEPAYGYSRTMLQNAAAYASPIDSPEIYSRSRPALANVGARTMSFDSGPYGRPPLSESDSMGQTVAGSSEYLRGRDINLAHHLQYKQHSAVQYPVQPTHVMYGLATDLSQEHFHYMTRPPPREMPPLQGVPGPPAGPPPQGSPRPVAVRLPTSVTWRRPRGPVTEFA